MPDSANTAPAVRLGYVIAYVPDIVATIEFYERAFGLKRRFVHGTEYGELETGATVLAFASEALRAANGFETANNSLKNPAAGIEIALVVYDLDAAWQQAVDAGAVPLKAPTEKPWGQRVSWVRDLNGILVELCTPVSGS